MNTSRVNRQTLPFIPNSRLVFTLPLGMKIIQGWVRLYGTVTIAGGTTNGAIFREGGPVELIERIKVIATPLGGSRYPGGTIVDCTARALLRYATIQRNGFYFNDQNGATLGNGAVGGPYAVELYIPIYWADPTIKEVAIAALNTDGDAQGTPGGTYLGLQVEIYTRDLSACFTGNDRSGTSTFNLAVDWVDERAAIVGDTYVRYFEDHVLLIPAAQERLLDQAMPQDGAFESWTILEEQGASATLASTLLLRIQAKSPVIDFDKYKPDMLQQLLDNCYIAPSTNSAGFNHVDWTDGIIQNMVPGGNIQTWFSVSNPSGANLDALRVFTRRLVRPLPASGQ